MEDRWERRFEYAVLGLTLLAVPVAAVVVLEVLALPRFDPGSVTTRGIVAAAVLAFAAIALPAYILFGWQSAERTSRADASHDRDRDRDQDRRS